MSFPGHQPGGRVTACLFPLLRERTGAKVVRQRREAGASEQLVGHRVRTGPGGEGLPPGATGVPMGVFRDHAPNAVEPPPPLSQLDIRDTG